MRFSFLLNRILSESTRAYWCASMSRPGASFWETLHGYCYLSWPRQYISLGLGRGWLGRWLQLPAYWIGTVLGLWSDNSGKRFADTYHAKVMPPLEIKRLIQVNRVIQTEVPETVLPYPMARDIVLENPCDLALFECPCRASASKPCLPLDVCIIVGQPFVNFVLEHHPRKSRSITPDEALEVVRASHQRGHVSHAFFKEAVLGRYYAICNCCTCCCGAMQAMRNGAPMLASSGYTAQVAGDRCTGCGLCTKKCPFSAITMQPMSGKRVSCISDTCLGCGICTLHCPQKALDLVRDYSKPSPLQLG